MMATGCLYDAVVALGKSHLELRRNLPYLLSEYVEIDKVNQNTCVPNSTSVFTSSKKKSILDVYFLKAAAVCAKIII